jgi:hypothetical protein
MPHRRKSSDTDNVPAKHEAMKIEEAEKYFLERCSELEAMCQEGTPWVFLCAAAMIEYLSKIVNGKDKGGEGYKEFVDHHLAAVRQEYATFRYTNGASNLAAQMYHVLRCGIMHSFSLIPDSRAQYHGGHDRSIVLAHRKEKRPHLSHFKSRNAPDSVCFVAEEFVEDIRKAVERIFILAKTDVGLRNNIEFWLKSHPPIAGNI